MKEFIVLHVNRVFARNYGSAQDLTSLMRAFMDHEEDLKAGRVPQKGMSKSVSLVTMTTENGSSTARTASDHHRQGLQASDLGSISEGLWESSQDPSFRIGLLKITSVNPQILIHERTLAYYFNLFDNNLVCISKYPPTQPSNVIASRFLVDYNASVYWRKRSILLPMHTLGVPSSTFY